MFPATGGLEPRSPGRAPQECRSYRTNRRSGSRSAGSAVSGEPVDIEQQTEALRERVGQVVLPEAFSVLMRNSGSPVAVEERCTGKELGPYQL